jgi:hypothetical protein
MPVVNNFNGDAAEDLSLKAETVGSPVTSSVYNVEGLDWVRVQATVSGNAWDSATLKLQASLDGVDWVDTSVSFSANGISDKFDVMALPLLRLTKGTDAASTSPVVRCVIFGEVET